MPIVIRGFISETEKLLEAMHFAISRKDYQTMKELAHTIEGSAGNIGAESLHLVCRDLMQLDLNELSEHAEPLVALAQQRFKATQAALIAYLSKSDRVSLVPSSTQ
jgi:HPt (histidine-containing phosphotransfer) domain-containing protein